MLNTYTATPENKAAILEHVRYEIEKTFIFFRIPNDRELEMESWLLNMLHSRVLLEFFQPKKQDRDDDVNCADFGFPAETVTLSPEHSLRFNKDMAHLTYSRLRHTPQTKSWNLEEVLLPLRKRTLDFMDHIISNPPDLMSSNEIVYWKDLKRRMTP